MRALNRAAVWLADPVACTLSAIYVQQGKYLVLIAFVVLYVILLRPRRREQ